MTTPPTLGQRARHVVGSTGLNRGMLIRRLIRLGSPRLRQIHFAASEPGLRGAIARPFVRWLERGSIAVPLGYAGGLRLSLEGIPLSHAHIGSIAYGNLEPSVQEAMLRHLGKGGVFYDIGANVGFFVLLAAHMVGLEEGHAYAFEPTPDNAAEIRRNVELNALPNVTTIEKAVADKAGRAQLQIVDDQSWSKLADYGEHPLTASVMDVELIAIDDVVADGSVRPPTVVKIDVEGAELAVLEGMRETLEQHQPVLIVELHDTHTEFAAFCRDVGYRVVNLEGPYDITDQRVPSAHALALPPGHLGD